MQDTLFPLPPSESTDKDPNQMVQCYGAGPAGAKCKTCKHLIVNRPGQNKYHKCKFRKQSNGPATDHKVRWNACGKYEKE